MLKKIKKSVIQASQKVCTFYGNCLPNKKYGAQLIHNQETAHYAENHKTTELNICETSIVHICLLHTGVDEILIYLEEYYFVLT